MNIQKLMSTIGIGVVLIYASVCHVGEGFAKDFPSSKHQEAILASAAQVCPTDLSSPSNLRWKGRCNI